VGGPADGMETNGPGPGFRRDDDKSA